MDQRLEAWFEIGATSREVIRPPERIQAAGQFRQLLQQREALETSNPWR
jgi:hypothetical protein